MKLFNKVAAIAVGVTLAAGVGAGIVLGNRSLQKAEADTIYSETPFSGLETGDIGVIAGVSGGNYYGLSNDKGTTNPPQAVSLTVANGKLSNAPAAELLWEVTVSNGSYQFTVINSIAQIQIMVLELAQTQIMLLPLTVDI